MKTLTWELKIHFDQAAIPWLAQNMENKMYYIYAQFSQQPQGFAKQR